MNELLNQFFIPALSFVFGVVFVLFVLFVLHFKRRNEPTLESIQNTVKTSKRKVEKRLPPTKQSNASPAKLGSDKTIGHKNNNNKKKTAEKKSDNVPTIKKIANKKVDKKSDNAIDDKKSKVNKSTASENNNVSNEKSNNFYYDGWFTGETKTGNQTDWTTDDKIDETSENLLSWDDVDNGKVMVYIDNSNIFIETRKHSARRKKFPSGMWDNNCRIDVGKLVNEARRGRDIIHGKLYGSEPPVLDTVWRAIREEKIQVNALNRSK